MIKLSNIFVFYIGIVTSAISFADTHKMTFGVIVPLSGPFASSGQTFKNSFILAQQHYDFDKSVTFFFEDSQMEPKLAVAALHKLMHKDRVSGVLVWGSPTSMAVNDIAERAQLPMISISMLDKVVENKKFILKHWIRIAPLMQATISEVKKRSYNTVAIITLLNDATLKQRDIFIESGVSKVLISEELDKSENDFRGIVTKVKNVNPDATYLLVWSPQLNTIARQLRAAGYNGAIFGAQSLEDPQEVAAAQGALNGAWFITSDDALADPYYQSYRNSFGELPAAGGTNAYDIARMIIEGAKQNSLNEYLHTIKDFSGVLGRYSVTPDNDFSFGVTLKCIKDGTIVRIGCSP